MSPAPLDRELALQAGRGDESAARTLFERHAGALRARVQALLPAALRRRISESDVVQETFADAFRGLDQFEDKGRGSFRAWLLCIAERRVRDQVRRHLDAKRRATGREIEAGRTSAPGPVAEGRGASPSDAAIERERQEEVRRLIAAMPKDYGTILRLVHQEGRRLCDAATAIGRSEEATRKLYARAVAEFERRIRSRWKEIP